MNMGVLLALLSAVAYGAADFVGGVASRRHAVWPVVFSGQVTGGIAVAIASVFVPGSPLASDFAWAVLAGIGSAGGSLFLLRGLSRGDMGLVAPISAVGAAVLPVVVGVALGERPSWLTWGGILIALPGIWLVSRGSAARGAPRSWGALGDGALAGAGFGLLFIALGQVSDDAGLLPIAANQGVGALATLLAATTLRQAWMPRPAVLPWGVASGVLGAAGTVTFLFATGATTLGVAAVLASLYPAVTVLLAIGVLRERTRAGQLVGIVLCLIAVATLAADG